MCSFNLFFTCSCSVLFWRSFILLFRNNEKGLWCYNGMIWDELTPDLPLDYWSSLVFLLLVKALWFNLIVVLFWHFNDLIVFKYPFYLVRRLDSITDSIFLRIIGIYPGFLRGVSVVIWFLVDDMFYICCCLCLLLLLGSWFTLVICSLLAGGLTVMFEIQASFSLNCTPSFYFAFGFWRSANIIHEWYFFLGMIW